MAGRRPKPTKLKELAGNPGHRPLNDLEPKPETGVPEMPKYLSRLGRRIWLRTVKELSDMGVLTVVDGLHLAAYCDNAAQVEYATRAVRKYGAVLEEDVIVNGQLTGKTKLTTNPAVVQRDNAYKLMLRFGTEFGLTPASRSKVKITKATVDEGDEFLDQNKDVITFQPRTGTSGE